MDQHEGSRSNSVSSSSLTTADVWVVTSSSLADVLENNTILKEAKVTVGPPFRVSSGETEFIAFSIRTQLPTMDVCVNRRFSEFEWLQDMLQQAKIREIPSMPPKRLIGNFDMEFLENRRFALQSYLCELLKNQLAASNKHCLYFLLHKHLPHPINCTHCKCNVDPNEHVPTMKGYMCKQGNWRNQWKSRYFLVSGAHLYYYYTEECVGLEPPKGVFDLADSKITTKGIMRDEEEKYVFIVHSGNDVVKLAAPSLESRNRWVEALVQAKLLVDDHPKHAAAT